MSSPLIMVTWPRGSAGYVALKHHWQRLGCHCIRPRCTLQALRNKAKQPRDPDPTVLPAFISSRIAYLYMRRDASLPPSRARAWPGRRDVVPLPYRSITCGNDHRGRSRDPPTLWYPLAVFAREKTGTHRLSPQLCDRPGDMHRCMPGIRSYAHFLLFSLLSTTLDSILSGSHLTRRALACPGGS